MSKVQYLIIPANPGWYVLVDRQSAPGQRMSWSEPEPIVAWALRDDHEKHR
jgi:hypothetical protein